jgi:hypothetical protein
VSYVFGSIFNYLKENGNSIREKMFASQSPILNEVSLLIEGMWNNLPGGHIDLPERIAAVDGGLLRYRLDNGGSLIIASSYLVARNIPEASKSICTFIYPPSRSIGFLIMRTLELELAEQAISNMNREDMLFLDGSLYGLMSHLPITPRNAPMEYGEVLLRFYDQLNRLLRKAEEKKIMLLNVSKYSSSRFLKEYILKSLFDEELVRLRNSSILEPRDLQHVETLPSLIYDNSVKALELSRRLRRKYGPSLEKINSIVEEFARQIPDLFLLKNYIQGLGFTNPILLGPSLKLQKLFKKISENVEEATLHYFKLNLNYVKDVKTTIEKMLNICSVCSFYLRLDSQDYPLKIDVPSYVFRTVERFFNVDELKMVENNSTTDEIVGVLKELYANKEIYNVWLYEADRKARINRKSTDIIYQILLKTIGKIDLARRGIEES